MAAPRFATLGSATLDVFLQGEALLAQRDVKSKTYVEQFPLGAKLELDDLTFSTGGGATNAAVTFARQGCDVTYLGKIADDLGGEQILQSLKSENIDTSLLACSLHGMSGYSTLLLAPRGERTVLVYRGVSEELNMQDFDMSRLDIDWLYISSLAGNLELLERITKWGEDHGVRVAYNPGSGELAQADDLKRFIPRLAVLLLNKQEAQQLYPGDTVEELLAHACRDCGITVITDGPRGSWASDGTTIYYHGMYEDVEVVDRTGAGDAFGSGFVAQIAAGQSLSDGLVFGSANSTSVVQYVGAKAGILRQDVTLKDSPVKTSQLPDAS